MADIKTVYILCNDVHYYLQDFFLENYTKKHLVLLTSGISFYPVPGQYKLPNREGYYNIDSDSNLLMNCKSSGRNYRHKHVELVD